MDTRLTVLKLFLEKLGISDAIDTVDDRKRVQKAVYLGQFLSRVDLGYRFGWYIMGPYSPDLTRDYYSLAEAIASGDREFEGMELVEPVRASLEQVLPILKKPQDFGGPIEDWLEIVASYHYLRRVSVMDDSEAKDTLNKKKPLLAPFAKLAEDTLREHGMLDQT